jgi:dephospho-CoA kinase
MLDLARRLAARSTRGAADLCTLAGAAARATGWAMQNQPRAQQDRAGARSGQGPVAGRGDRLPVIGLAGGIGSGKSEVARLLAARGCYVIDSDAAAREVLQRPEVRDELVRWWGRGILGTDGSVDRRAVAKIVFADPEERRRLEGLVHPLVRARRGELIEEARRRGAPAAVIDAPLLFEAEVDRECDAVIFVDAPRQERLRRVRESRGWSKEELERREGAQMPLEEKRRRSTYVVENAGDREALGRAVAEVLGRIVGGSGDAASEYGSPSLA